MSDFTGLGMQDHFKAIVAERERQIAGGAWRRRWKELHEPDADPQCCSTADEPHREHAPAPSRALGANG